MSGSPFTREETATILAALRFWQRRALHNGCVSLDEGNEAWREVGIATDGGEVKPLTADEIDNLCMMVNTL